jgi:uncharacterized repeat protein (TIGR02543 family)
LNHDNRVWDTSDYCLRVYNVSIGLSEIQSLNKDKTAIEELIIKTADPDIRVRNSAYTWKDWTRLAIERLSFDFSRFSPVPNENGYEVTVTAPAIQRDTDSTIPFTVYVVDDLPKPIIATVSFFGTNISDMHIEITNSTSLALSDIETPVKDGYTFKGWYLDKDCTEPFLIQGSSEYAKQAITEDLTLYSKWQLASAFLEPPQEQTKQEGIQERPKAMVISEEPGALAQKPNLVLSAENTQTPLHETKTQEKIVQNNEQDTVAPEPVTFENKTTKSKIGVPMYEYLILVLFTATAVCFGHSIFLDLRVLKWYKRKKIAYMAKHEVTS